MQITVNQSVEDMVFEGPGEELERLGRMARLAARDGRAHAALIDKDRVEVRIRFVRSDPPAPRRGFLDRIRGRR